MRNPPSGELPIRTGPRIFLNLTPSNGGGGGGDRSPTPASRGALPHFDDVQFAPPEVVLRNLAPQLAVVPTLLGVVEPTIRTVEALGDPMGKEGPPSNGPGSNGGIGTGKRGGVGPGDGRGAGPGEDSGITSTVYRAMDGVTLPQLIHKVEPEFTDEARKARYQGGVLLRVIVGPDGLVQRVQLLKALGLGLDERAIEAVRQWRFRPGTKNGRPVNVEAEVEVTFRLL